MDQPIYGSYLMRNSAPKNEMPKNGTTPRMAKQLLLDELSLDGNPHLNLASFVTTYMEPEAEEIMLLGMKKNFIDLDEYGQTAEIHNRCVNIIANLFNAPPPPEGKPCVGTSTIGSSEAIMLAMLAMKWKWKARRKAAGLPFDKPNIVCGSNIQVCWHKAARYFEVECIEAHVSPDSLSLTPDRAEALLNENCIGVAAILGSTFNGEFEDVKGIHDMVVRVNEKNRWNIPVHVDAASGGFIAPFITPDLEWDFRLPQVKSINVSGHKFGLVYAGIGWAIWRSPDDLPEELIFHVNYLGGDQASFTLNFSKGASCVLAQYYNFVRSIVEAGMANADYLRNKLISLNLFNIVDKGHMPLVAFSLIDSRHFTVFDLQDKMKNMGWIIPAYKCSKGAESLAIMRIVVKQNFSCDIADLLVDCLVRAVDHLIVVKRHFDNVNGTGKSMESYKRVLQDLEHKKVLHSHSNEVHPKQHREEEGKTHGVC